MPRTAADLMWADALARLARADRLHQDFFRPAPTGWEPPVDLLETDQELILMAALPGVRAIVGTRLLPAALRLARVHRMELPHGRFERRVALPPGTYELARREIQDGLLLVVLRKIG